MNRAPKAAPITTLSTAFLSNSRSADMSAFRLRYRRQTQRISRSSEVAKGLSPIPPGEAARPDIGGTWLKSNLARSQASSCASRQKSSHGARRVRARRAGAGTAASAAVPGTNNTDPCLLVHHRMAEHGGWGPARSSLQIENGVTLALLKTDEFFTSKFREAENILQGCVGRRHQAASRDPVRWRRCLDGGRAAVLANSR